MTLQILLVSGIWPPAVGGPASHGPEFGRFLVDRGHWVRAVTTAPGSRPPDPGFPLITSRSDRSRVFRQPAAAIAVLDSARRADVIYATGMYGRSAFASALHRLPLVLKLVNDPAYERARRLSLFEGSLETFQQPHRDPALRALKRLRLLALSRASRVVVPSRYLAEIASTWGLRADSITVIPNPAPSLDPSSTREELRERLGLRFPTFVFAGRLVSQKNVPLAISALEAVPEASLALIGDGPERGEIASRIAASGVADRVTMTGALPRSETIEWLRAADVAVLPSDFENFPHAVVEALAMGTPVIATSVGGVPEMIKTGINGLLVPRGDAAAFGGAMSKVIQDEALLTRLRAGASAAGEHYRSDAIYERIEAELELAVASGREGGSDAVGPITSPHSADPD